MKILTLASFIGSYFCRVVMAENSQQENVSYFSIDNFYRRPKLGGGGGAKALPRSKSLY